MMLNPHSPLFADRKRRTFSRFERTMENYWPKTGRLATLAQDQQERSHLFQDWAVSTGHDDLHQKPFEENDALADLNSLRWVEKRSKALRDISLSENIVEEENSESQSLDKRQVTMPKAVEPGNNRPFAPAFLLPDDPQIGRPLLPSLPTRTPFILPEEIASKPSQFQNIWDGFKENSQSSPSREATSPASLETNDPPIPVAGGPKGFNFRKEEIRSMEPIILQKKLEKLKEYLPIQEYRTMDQNYYGLNKTPIYPRQHPPQVKRIDLSPKSHLLGSEMQFIKLYQIAGKGGKANFKIHFDEDRAKKGLDWAKHLAKELSPTSLLLPANYFYGTSHSKGPRKGKAYMRIIGNAVINGILKQEPGISEEIPPKGLSPEEYKKFAYEKFPNRSLICLTEDGILKGI